MQTLTKKFILKNENKTYAIFAFNGTHQITIIIMSGKLKDVLTPALKLIPIFTNPFYMDKFFAKNKKFIEVNKNENYHKHVSLQNSYYLVPIEPSEIKNIIISQKESLNYLKEHINDSILLGAINS
jgi:hypothetical protein